MTHRIQPPIHVKTPLGEGWAIFLIDYGHDWNTCWVVNLFETGQVKHFDANDIRITGNPTWNVPEPTTPKQDTRPGN
tara:strand:- start:6563 stop:6793 length:231 start_codon:yes stop_codon:yes gene_type:complete